MALRALIVPTRSVGTRHRTHKQLQTPPSGGRTESLCKGLSGMDAARAPMGQGWPFDACPWNDDGANEPGAKRRAGWRGKPFWFLLGRLPKGTRPAGRNHCLSQYENPQRHEIAKQQSKSRHALSLTLSRKRERELEQVARMSTVENRSASFPTYSITRTP